MDGDDGGQSEYILYVLSEYILYVPGGMDGEDGGQSLMAYVVSGWKEGQSVIVTCIGSHSELFPD